MHIVVKTLDGQTITLNVKKSDTIDNIKTQIQEKGFEATRIYYDNKQQEDDRLISDYIPVFEVGDSGEKKKEKDEEEGKGSGDEGKDKDEGEKPEEEEPVRGSVSFTSFAIS